MRIGHAFYKNQYKLGSFDIFENESFEKVAKLLEKGDTDQHAVQHFLSIGSASF